MYFAIICFVVFFAVSLGCFVFRDYWLGLRLMGKELQQGQKQVRTFTARKYEDFIYKHCLLFYAGKENVYIKIDRESFSQLQDGDTLSMEFTPITGVILRLSFGRTNVAEA